MEMYIKRNEIHSSSFDSLGELYVLNVEKEWSFLDFIEADELNDEEYSYLEVFSFETVVSDNRFCRYFNQMMLELNQLNYGTKRYDISSDEELYDALNSCVEFEGLGEETKQRIFSKFITAIDNFKEFIWKEEERWERFFQEDAVSVS